MILTTEIMPARRVACWRVKQHNLLSSVITVNIGYLPGILTTEIMPARRVVYWIVK